MTIPDITPRVLELCDAGTPVADIATATTLPASKVYALLREHRPDRPRSPRRRTSELRMRILALSKVAEPARVAKLLKGTCSRAYVYRICKEGQR